MEREKKLKFHWEFSPRIFFSFALKWAILQKRFLNSFLFVILRKKRRFKILNIDDEKEES